MAQSFAGELVNAGHAHEAHAAFDLVLEQAKRAFDAVLTGRCERVKVEATTARRRGAGAERLESVCATAHSAIADDLDIAAYRINDLFKLIEG